MRGWRSRFVFTLVVYFAGFATAIYCLSPVPEDYDNQVNGKGFPASALKSDQFAETFNVKMHEFLGIAKEAADQAGSYVKQKIDERQTDI